MGQRAATRTACQRGDVCSMYVCIGYRSLVGYVTQCVDLLYLFASLISIQHAQAANNYFTYIQYSRGPPEVLLIGEFLST